MNLSRRHCAKLHRSIAQHLGTTSTNMAAAFLSIAYLAALALFLILAGCAPNPTTTPTHVRLTPRATDTLTPTVRSTLTAIPASTLLPPVTLEEPEDGACLDCEQEVTLCWSCPRVLQAKEYYRLRVKGQAPSLFYHTVYHKEDHFTLPTLSPGKYDWSVAMVRSTAQDNYELVSEESDSYSFEIALPIPIVHSISPTGTVQGTSVAVVVSGANFTRSLALTIGVPLQATFVNSSTITATIPITLEVDEYPVIVKGATAEGGSSVSFAVSELPPPPPPAARPWNPATPVPTAPPGYDPSQACVVKPCALAPQLVEPEDGAEVTFNSSVHLKWRWDYCLPPGWKFAVRISDAYPPHSHHYVDNPILISCQDGKMIGRYPVDEKFTTKPSTYYWNIAVARSVEGGWERLSENSRTCTFVILTPSPSSEGPDRPD